jgi:GNAT superfamily N-acetyltransferase
MEDAAEIARLTNELGYEAPTSLISLRLAAFVAKPRYFVAVAEIQPGILGGWLSAERRLILHTGEKVEISGLVVDRTKRRTGIGSSLIVAVEQWAAESGIASLVVRSQVDRPESHAFYMRAGYIRDKTQHVYSKCVIPNRLERARNE